jgi:hypothetical protein
LVLPYLSRAFRLSSLQFKIDNFDFSGPFRRHFGSHMLL